MQTGRRRVWPRVLLTVVLTALGVSAAVGIGYVAAGHLPSRVPRAAPSGEHVATPAAPPPPPPPPDPHKLAGDVPVSISIPSVGIRAPVVGTGRTGNGAMAVTPQPNIADWFEVGTYPGDVGSAVIAGHSGFAAGPAAFDPLPNVRRGALVYVQGSKGRSLTFRVIGARDYAADSSAPEVFSRNDGRYLNLVSCTGTWNSQLGTHNLRLVVFTRLVDQ